MIQAEFLMAEGGAAAGFHITGHAGGEAGTDIVCAAVSSAAYLVANTVTEVMGLRPRELRAEDGDMLLELDRNAGSCFWGSGSTLRDLCSSTRTVSG